MMTKENPGKFVFLRKLSSVLLFFMMTATLTFSQDTLTINKPEPSGNFENEWWFPLLRKHNIDLKHYTYFGNYKPGQGDSTGQTALELGCNASINKKLFTLKEPVFIIRENDDTYTLITAEFASLDMANSRKIWIKGKIEGFKFKTMDLNPTQSLTYDTLSMDSKTKTFRNY